MKTIYNTRIKAFLSVLIFFGISLLVNASELPAVDNLNAVAMEESLFVEPWMTDLNNWDVVMFDENFDSIEEEIAFEDWMVEANSGNWEVLEIIDQESDQEVESWMTDLNQW
ncbi:MAG TPA: hypothetical protein DDX98_09570 [Bacteroidales bacterium]|jgi:hypothetical protein|nr:hypothetical protein [Bacteroidales bacterium]